jgi:hypothetical protein
MLHICGRHKLIVHHEVQGLLQRIASLAIGIHSMGSETVVPGVQHRNAGEVRAMEGSGVSKEE